nr:chorismate-binding protein [Euryarchaeota archaeon]
MAIIWQVERWLIHDKPSNTLHVLSNERDEWGAKVKKFLESWKYEPREVLPAILNGSETSSHTDLQHADIVRVVKKAITAGQLYQLNFGRRWMGELHENPWETMLRLAHDSPAPYSSWLYCPDQKIALCSSSPELLLASDGGIISTRPIKGTRPRGRDPQEEFSLRSELLKCKKENAEHRMLVDLERNELGVVCRPASIEHTLFQVESYPQVQHLVSEVKGELKSECDLWDALQATFPGGSITGCPKTVTCSAIDLLEKHPRSFWTGSIGYIDPRTSKSAWNILIRTLEAHQDNGDNGVGSGEKWQAIIQAGGGLVIGSNPEAEVDEAKWKAEALRKAAGWIERSENEGSFCAEIAIHPQPIKKQINRGFTETGDIFEGKNIDSTILKKTGSKKVRIIFIDNLDSFSYNIMHSCCGMGADVIRLCGITTPVDSFNELLSTLKPSHIILGPGPGRPNSSILTQYISKQSLLGSITNLEGDVIPILGICLGHQALGEADGMELIESPLGAVHGQPSQILHNGEGIFSQIQQPAIMARYNSLILKEKGGNNGGGYIPNQLIVNAWDETKTLPMAFYHPTLPIFGIQFHP